MKFCRLTCRILLEHCSRRSWSVQPNSINCRYGDPLCCYQSYTYLHKSVSLVGSHCLCVVGCIHLLYPSLSLTLISFSLLLPSPPPPLFPSPPPLSSSLLLLLSLFLRSPFALLSSFSPPSVTMTKLNKSVRNTECSMTLQTRRWVSA